VTFVFIIFKLGTK